ncbi:hypothetical protein [Aeromonas veronii]|uniref:hypothetical protein n=1 Tax=Aeromonas veronii TaxID=654 RepID=UPI001F2A6212|nr:hypothetical protein [Aeromonas veronii]MCF5873182.1 hypothetical protein [Aeromonas veronii]
MNNEALWILTAESVSDVFYASDMPELIVNNFNQSMSDDSIHEECMFARSSDEVSEMANCVVVSTRRIVKRMDFSIASSGLSSDDVEHKVFMVR